MMSAPHKRRHHPKHKTSCRVTDWPEYEKSLRGRGDLKTWFSQYAIDAWTPPKTRKRDVQQMYSDLAIAIAMTLSMLFHQRLRETEGFLGSFLKLMGLDLPCRDYTTLSPAESNCGCTKTH